MITPMLKQQLFERMKEVPEGADKQSYAMGYCHGALVASLILKDAALHAEACLLEAEVYAAVMREISQPSSELNGSAPPSPEPEADPNG